MSRKFIHLRPLSLVYARIPKVANSSIKNVLASLIATNPAEGLKPTNDRFWRVCTGEDADWLNAADYTSLYNDCLSFTFVREPMDRLFSCYVNKILANGCRKPFSSRGYRADMDFNGFVAHTCSMEPGDMEVHTQPQAYLASDNLGRLPHFVGCYERLDADWTRLVNLCKTRGHALPDTLPVLNRRTEAKQGVSRKVSDETLRMFRAKFREDLEMHAKVLG